MAIPRFDCFRCRSSQQHFVVGTAFKKGDFYETDDDIGQHEDDEFRLYQCRQCQSLSLWEMEPDIFSLGTKEKPRYICLYEEPVKGDKIDFLEFKKMDQKLAKVLDKRVLEAHLCLSQGAYLASIILMGSVLEGMLTAVFENHLDKVMPNAPTFFNKKANQREAKKLKDWTLAEMIDIAKTIKFISSHSHQYCTTVREFRNLVHPNELIKHGKITVDKTTAQITSIAVQGICKELSKRL